MIFRNIVNIVNNGLGHVLYVNQLIQDGLAGSVVGAEFTPLTAAANEVLSGVKVALDEVQMGTDIVVEVEAQYQANHAPDSTEAEHGRPSPTTTPRTSWATSSTRSSTSSASRARVPRTPRRSRRPSCR